MNHTSDTITLTLKAHYLQRVEPCTLAPCARRERQREFIAIDLRRVLEDSTSPYFSIDAWLTREDTILIQPLQRDIVTTRRNITVQRNLVIVVKDGEYGIEGMKLHIYS